MMTGQDWLIHILQGRSKRLFKQKRRDSWKNYVSSVHVNTPSKRVWDMVRKITGKYVASPMHHLKDENGILITDRVEIANTLGAAIEKVRLQQLLQRVPIHQDAKGKAKDQPILNKVQ